MVPDERAWALWGRDPRTLGLEPVAAPEQAEALVVPDPVPQALAGAVAEAWARIPRPRRLLAWEAGLAGMPAEAALEEHPAGRDGEPAHATGGHEDGAGEHDGGHGDHDHHAMMEIRGEPSEDRLVMEPIELAVGPLSPSLAGGLVLQLVLDGDVVREGRADATLSRASPDRPDPLAAKACGAALARARGAPRTWLQLAAVETERALGHAAWLRSLGRLLGWQELVALAHAAVVSLLGPHRALPGPDGGSPLDRRARADVCEALGHASRALRRLQRRLEGSRRLAARTAGRGALSGSRLADTAVGGPVARAAGLARDARLDDPLYAKLGFRPELRAAGDAEARTLVRSAEAVAAVRLALSALGQEHDPPPTTTAGGGWIEAPRGPVRVSLEATGPAFSAPGQRRQLELAGELVAGLELAGALVAVASLDLSPWRLEE